MATPSEMVVTRESERVGRVKNFELGGRKRGATGPAERDQLHDVYHVASLLRVTTELCDRSSLRFSCATVPRTAATQRSQATRKKRYPAFFKMVVDVGDLSLRVAVVTGCVVVVTGATWLFTVNTTGFIGWWYR